MNDCFALVYVDYEWLSLLEIGDREFIIKKYSEYIEGLKKYTEKFGEIKKKYEYVEDGGLFAEETIKEMYDTTFYSQDVQDRYCIMGYKDGKLGCVCRDFGIILDEPILY